MIGIYHNRDLDGFASGAIIKMKYPDATMIGHDYGMDFKVTEEMFNAEIIMADISLPMEDMYKLADLAKKLTWIDHHVSAIKDYEKFSEGKDKFCNAVLGDGEGACELTWELLYPGVEMPLAIQLLGEYDTWNKDKHHWDSAVLPFQFGMKACCNSVESFPSGAFLGGSEFVDQIIQEGATIIKYQSQVNELQCKKAAFEYKFDGMRAICLNNGGFNSDLFKSVYDEKKHDIMMPFQFDGKKWTVSLYTTKDTIDCSVLAKARGGGGHKKAAGFQVENIEEVFTFIKPTNNGR